jgi:hypothetical protein
MQRRGDRREIRALPAPNAEHRLLRHDVENAGAAPLTIEGLDERGP